MAWSAFTCCLSAGREEKKKETARRPKGINKGLSAVLFLAPSGKKKERLVSASEKKGAFSPFKRKRRRRGRDSRQLPEKKEDLTLHAFSLTIASEGGKEGGMRPQRKRKRNPRKSLLFSALVQRKGSRQAY